MKLQKQDLNTRKGQFISGTLLITILGIGGTAFLGYKFISALAVVANYASLTGALVVSGAVVYYGFEEGYLDDFFSSKDTELVFLVLMGAGLAPLLYRLFESLISALGGLLGVLLIGLVTLAVFFSPAFVFGGLASIVGFIADLMGIFGGEN